MSTQSGVILVVDDDRVSRTLHREILSKKYDVITASSGQEALKIFDALEPDLVLMDAIMPEMDGYQTSEIIRKRSRVPIIFVTANTSLDDHLRAYDSGGTGIMVKPIDADLLTRKVEIALERYQAACNHKREQEKLHEIAMNFLSSAGQTGALLNFMRNSISAPTYENLANCLLEATGALGLNCSIRIRYGDEHMNLSFHGPVTQLEQSILENSAEMGRIFQFRSRLVINYDRITLMVSNMPEGEDGLEAGRVRDNLAILAEAAQALLENIDVRRNSAEQAEKMQLALSSAEQALDELRSNQYQSKADIHLLLQELLASVEKSFSWLNTTQQQEAEIMQQMQNSVRKILKRLSSETNFEKPVENVLKALKTGYESPNSIELF